MQEERRRGQVHHSGEAEFTVDGLEARNPQARRLVVLFRLFSFITLEFFIIVTGRFFPVTVMGLVIQHEDIFQGHQFGHYPLQHLAFRFQGVQRLTAALEQGTPAFR